MGAKVAGTCATMWSSSEKGRAALFEHHRRQGNGADAQPLLIWKNVKCATYRMTFDPAQLQIHRRTPAGHASMPPNRERLSNLIWCTRL